MECCYKVAELGFKLILPDDKDAEKLLASFRAFASDAVEEPSFVLEANACFSLPDDAEKLLSEDNDAGHTEVYDGGEEYFMSFSFGTAGHLMRVTKSYDRACATIVWEDRYAGAALSSMLRALFAQVVILNDGVSFHASAIVQNGSCYMFMGSSGTGKSTHSRLWMEVFQGVELLNDDNPVVRALSDGIYAYGSPWSGKTACYINRRCPLSGIVKLVQAPYNRFKLLKDIEAFVEIYKGSSFLKADVQSHDLLCDTLSSIVERLKVARLDCLPDVAAAELCREKLIEE